MSSIDDLTERLASYLEPDQIDQVRKSYLFAAEAHEGQYRKSGEPYATHPLAAAGILAEMHMDHYCLMGAMLHDVIEDTPATKKVLKKKFGETVAEIVDGVSKLNKMETRDLSREQKQAEDFVKMTLAMSKDIRVILVKLADRLHNMRTLDALPPEKRRRIARETLDIFAPIAQRLGINDMRVEFEDRGFEMLYPMRARRLEAALEIARKRRKDLVTEIHQAIEARLEIEGFEARVQGREKHLYSIYKKMRKKRSAFKDVMDVFAFRITVSTVDQCYRALGIVHNLFKPMAGTFKDYIAIPKANGYQSLHTMLVGMHGVPIEVQIRTREMDDMANFGIAAHWFYKSQGGEDTSAVSTRTGEWVKRLLDLQKSAGNPLEFIEHVKTDLFPDEVYVFTPKGKIIELPRGSTVVDFAFALHTDIGNSCVGCKINNKLSSLSQKLESGQVVEVLRAAKVQPHPAWLNFVVTAKARSAIRHSLKSRRHEESIGLGRRLLNKVLADVELTLDDIKPKQIKAFVKENQFESFDEVLEQIGLGDRVPYVVAKKLVSRDLEESLSDKFESPIVIDSSEEQVVHFSACCFPIPGDPIAGHFSSGRGLVVHCDDCPNLQEIRQKSEDWLPISWAKEITGEFQVGLWVEVDMFRGVVAQLAARITDGSAGIETISIEERGASVSVLKIMLRVTDRVHLANIMRLIRLEPYVNKLQRGANV